MAEFEEQKDRVVLGCTSIQLHAKLWTEWKIITEQTIPYRLAH